MPYRWTRTWPLAHLEDADAIKVRLEPRLLAAMQRTPGLRWYWHEQGPMYPGHWLEPSLLLVVEWPSREAFEAARQHRKNNP